MTPPTIADIFKDHGCRVGGTILLVVIHGQSSLLILIVVLIGQKLFEYANWVRLSFKHGDKSGGGRGSWVRTPSSSHSNSANLVEFWKRINVQLQRRPRSRGDLVIWYGALLNLTGLFTPMNLLTKRAKSWIKKLLKLENGHVDADQSPYFPVTTSSQDSCRYYSL